ncbi:MAG: DUF559 domain-containing protein, partial [Actinoallomurus sp.]
GWPSKESCPLFREILDLSQTDDERKFLHTYMRYVRDREFPMLLPQARIGITDRRRADFVAFVPLHFWKFKWFVIELDGGHREEQQAQDKLRNKYYEEHGYEIISLRPGVKGYFEEARSLIERFDVLMALADTDAADLAVEARVLHFDPGIPF